mmetsp:Transcript_14437/g.16814  ORF Transcript_14437/g.16814 Transcript_14437/m.16814 type:complete len:475 (-) Transcript_14437:93-1517(-)
MSFLSRCRNVWKTLFKKTESPREIQERHDLYKIALAVTFRDLRKGSILSSLGASSASTSTNSTSKIDQDKSNAHINYYDTQSIEELEQIYDEASEILEDKVKIHELNLRPLRREIQQLLRPQVLSLLETCKKVEEELPSTTILEPNSEEYVMKSEVNKNRCRDILFEEQGHTLDLLENANNKRIEDDNVKNETSKQIEFLSKKLAAIQSIASFNSWEHFYFSDVTQKDTSASASDDGADEFGYIQSKDEFVNNSIRYYQMINISRSALIRQHLGYSVLALKSTIRNAGRGAFVDGFAPAGSLLAFFPGQVWPKEYVLNANTVAPYFKADPRHHLSIRYDDILIDSRKAPYTVLDDTNSNLFSIAHIVNHPSKLDGPNCCTAAIDFTDDMNIKELNVEKFVPNVYKKAPMFLGPQALNRDSVAMHSFGLLSSRSLRNEEMFYDYRLSSGAENSYPEWYHIFNEEELKNRWYQKTV